jgi:hypothetical protein
MPGTARAGELGVMRDGDRNKRTLREGWNT